jgi:hypothetical protein
MRKLVRCNECNGTGHFYHNDEIKETPNTKNHWNYKILAHEEPDGSFYFKIHEVYYEDGKPIRYSTEPSEISSDTLHGIVNVLSMIEKDVMYSIYNVGRLKGFNIYYAGDRFPEEYTDVIGNVK